MTARNFNTLRAFRTLEASGIENRQAEAIVTVMNRQDLVTKPDLESAVTVLRTDFESLRADFATFRADLYRALWIQGVGVVAVIGVLIAISGALKLL